MKAAIFLLSFLLFATFLSFSVGWLGEGGDRPLVLSNSAMESESGNPESADLVPPMLGQIERIKEVGPTEGRELPMEDESYSGLSSEELDALHLNLSYRFEGASIRDLERAYGEIHGSIPAAAYVSLHERRLKVGEYETIRDANAESANSGFELSSEVLQGNLPIVTRTFSRPDGFVGRTRIEPIDVVGYEEQVHSLIWIVGRMRRLH